MANKGFFEVAKQQSQVKAAIVSKYFDAWATVMMANQDRFPQYGKKILYLDLFAGPGRYEDGTKSTPLMVLEKAIANTKLRNRLASIFNDKDESNTQSLQDAIDQLPGIHTLTYKPEVFQGEIGSKIVTKFESVKMVPTFFFVDPWGYKGLSLQLINSVLKDWGCDCVFFFNYNRINMGLPNRFVEESLNALFGQSRADALRINIKGISPMERELVIIEELCLAIKDNIRSSRSPTQRPFVLPFKFKNESGVRTSHHLIFISKDFAGYEIMKNIMAKESSTNYDGVPSFEYNPATERQPFLFHFQQPLNDLKKQLLIAFAGQTKQMVDIYREHNVDTNFVKSNYKEVLLELESTNQIKADSRGKRRVRGRFGDDVWVTFP